MWVLLYIQDEQFHNNKKIESSKLESVTIPLIKIEPPKDRKFNSNYKEKLSKRFLLDSSNLSNDQRN